MTRRGFTIVELIIVITIIGILLTLAVVSLNGTQAKARDDERTTDIETIAVHLENFYSNGPVGSSSNPGVVNLVVNPSFETNTTSWATDPGQPAIVRDTTTAFQGSSSERLNSTGSNQYLYTSPSTIPSSAGKTYTASVFVKGTGTARLNFRSCAGSCGALLGQSSIITLSNSWQRLSATGTTGSGVTMIYFSVNQMSSGTNTMYVDAGMVTETPYLTSYADGTATSWSWSGTAHASTSSGFTISPNPGVYPDASITQSALLQVYLPDIDPKTLRAPGVANPSDSFVAATNNVQTTAGVAPQPTTDQYVYQPIDSDGNLCFDYDCRKFNLYYRLESDDTVYKYESKNR